MRGVREETSTRLRASLRGLIPAVVTLMVFLGAGVVLRTVFPSRGDEVSLGETLLLRFLLGVLYVLMILLGLRIAMHLDERPYAAFGLNLDHEWLRNFAVGAVFSATGIALSLGWGVIRGFRTFDASIEVSGPGGPVYIVFAIIVLLLYLLLGNVYEEIIYRGVMLQNFAEGLRVRGFSSTWATVAATIASLVLFGLYHLPLRGNFLVVIDSAMIGITFALAYLLTARLGLAIGIHFGRFPIELVTGTEILGVTVPSILEITRDTLAANLEVRLLEIGLICLFILMWVYLTDGRIQIAEEIYEPIDNSPGAG